MSQQPKSFPVEFTEAEAQALFSLLHIAVKSAGLEGPHAANAIHFQQKLTAAHKAFGLPDRAEIANIAQDKTD